MAGKWTRNKKQIVWRYKLRGNRILFSVAPLFVSLCRLFFYWCPVNVFNSFKIRYLSLYKSLFLFWYKFECNCLNSSSWIRGHCVISNVCFMRSSAALVYNCKQACIVLAGTSFATTGALAPQRSAERKVRLQRGREFEQTHKQKISNSSGLTATSSYPRGGVYGNY